MRSGFLAVGFIETANQIFKDIAAVHRADFVGSEIALGRGKFLDHQIKRVALHHAPDDAVKIELRQHVLHILRKSGEVIAEIALDIVRVSESRRTLRAF